MNFNMGTLNKVGSVVALCIEVQVTILLIAVLFVPIPPGNKEVFGQIVTTLLAIDIMVASFFYGTTVGSQAKDNTTQQQSETIATLAKSAVTPAGDSSTTLQSGDKVTTSVTDTGATLGVKKDQ